MERVENYFNKKFKYLLVVGALIAALLGSQSIVESPSDTGSSYNPRNEGNNQIPIVTVIEILYKQYLPLVFNDNSSNNDK